MACGFAALEKYSQPPPSPRFTLEPGVVVCARIPSKKIFLLFNVLGSSRRLSRHLFACTTPHRYDERIMADQTPSSPTNPASDTPTTRQGFRTDRFPKLVADRRAKLERLRTEFGIDPFGERQDGLITLAEARSRYGRICRHRSQSRSRKTTIVPPSRLPAASCCIAISASSYSSRCVTPRVILQIAVSKKKPSTTLPSRSLSWQTWAISSSLPALWAPPKPARSPSGQPGRRASASSPKA